MPNKELRNERYEKGTETQKYLYSDENSGLMMLNIAKKYRLEEESTYKKFAIVVGDAILGFYQTKDVASILQKELGLDQVTTQYLTADVLEFLKPLSDPNWTSPDTEITPTTAADTITSEIAEAEAALETLSPIRTMAGDSRHTPAPAESTYSSMQSAILGEGK